MDPSDIYWCSLNVRSVLRLLCAIGLSGLKSERARRMARRPSDDESEDEREA